jgi:hypothetical protein
MVVGFWVFKLSFQLQRCRSASLDLYPHPMLRILHRIRILNNALIICRLIKVSDPHHFNVDPDPAFHFIADLGLAPHQGDANLQSLAYKPSRPPF